METSQQTMKIRIGTKQIDQASDKRPTAASTSASEPISPTETQTSSDSTQSASSAAISADTNMTSEEAQTLHNEHENNRGPSLQHIQDESFSQEKRRPIPYTPAGNNRNYNSRYNSKS